MKLLYKRFEFGYASDVRSSGLFGDVKRAFKVLDKAIAIGGAGCLHTPKIGGLIYLGCDRPRPAPNAATTD
jgi:hypothetical protein